MGWGGGVLNGIFESSHMGNVELATNKQTRKKKTLSFAQHVDMLDMLLHIKSIIFSSPPFSRHKICGIRKFWIFFLREIGGFAYSGEKVERLLERI